MKNKLTDLNNHLFAQLERLVDEDIRGESLQEEILRADAVAGIAKQLLQSGDLSLRAARFMDNRNNSEIKNPTQLLGD